MLRSVLLSRDRMRVSLTTLQTALIAHQPSLAIQYYTTAALPPHRSAPACLALGSLLARGSSLLQNGETPVPGSRSTRSSDQSDKTITNGQSTVARIRAIFFAPSPPVDETAASPLPSPKDQIKPVAVGWGIPRLGNKAVRDVESMGIASAWFVLGLGWIVEAEDTGTPEHGTATGTSSSDDEDQEAVVMSFRSSTARTPGDQHAVSRSMANAREDSSPDLSHTDSEQTDSTVLKTPFTEDGTGRPYGGGERKDRSEYAQLKLLVRQRCSSLRDAR